MVIKYISQHDSADDPGGLIYEVLQLGAEFKGPAEDIILAWTLRLEEGRDAGEAAQRLIAAYGLDEEAPTDGAAGRLVALLREAASYPEAKLLGHVRPHRKGGRRRER